MTISPPFRHGSASFRSLLASCVVLAACSIPMTATAQPSPEDASDDGAADEGRGEPAPNERAEGPAAAERGTTDAGGSGTAPASEESANPPALEGAANVEERGPQEGVPTATSGEPGVPAPSLSSSPAAPGDLAELQDNWAEDPLGGAPAGPPRGDEPEAPVVPEPPPEEEGTDKLPFDHFFDHINVRGYTQLRYNHLGQTNPRLVNVQADKSMGGDGGGFFFRRARIVLSGHVHPQVQIYFQPDFVSAPSSDPLNFAQIRDWYADISDPSTEFRVRVGQSKVPFGFENMQSSSNRLPLDRSDALNSAVANERDIGLFFYYAPVEVRRRFKHLVASGLKGSGDYGMAGIGIYNGQTANRPEKNENKHVVARLTYPFKLGEQYLELGAAGYAGKFVVKKDPEIGGGEEFRDARAQATFNLYPQPFGLLVEYNVGIGPELDGREVLQPDGSSVFTGEIREQFLHGGYALASFVVGDFIPYVRGFYYRGGKKHETNAPSYTVRELEMGVEWHIIKALELVSAYTIADRTFSEPPYNLESGRLFRFQLQINY